MSSSFLIVHLQYFLGNYEGLGLFYGFSEIRPGSGLDLVQSSPGYSCDGSASCPVFLLAFSKCRYKKRGRMGGRLNVAGGPGFFHGWGL